MRRLNDLLKSKLKPSSLEDEGGETKQTKTKIFLVGMGNGRKLGTLTWK